MALLVSCHNDGRFPQKIPRRLTGKSLETIGGYFGGLLAHAGMSISDFDSNDIGGILALSANIQDKIMPMLEWDNINNFTDSRFNLGVRFYLIPNFHFDFALRGIGQGGTYTDGLVRGPERIVQFKYTGNF